MAQIALKMARMVIHLIKPVRYNNIIIKNISHGGIMMSKIALVTGASSGIGAMPARELAKAGFTVYAAARRVDKMEELKKTE